MRHDIAGVSQDVPRDARSDQHAAGVHRHARRHRGSAGLGPVRSLPGARQPRSRRPTSPAPSQPRKAFAAASCREARRAVGRGAGRGDRGVRADRGSRSGRLLSYAQLLFAGDSTDAAIGRFYQTVNERVTAISSAPDLLHAGAEPAGRRRAGGKAAPIRRWPAGARGCAICACSGRTSLSDELEKLLHEKEVTGHAAWSRLFDETVAGMRITVGGEALTVSAALNKLSDRDRSVREAAGTARSARRSAATSSCSR